MTFEAVLMARAVVPTQLYQEGLCLAEHAVCRGVASLC